MGCKLIENAKNDPKWDDSKNAELCPGECSTKCPHYLTQIPAEVLDNTEARNIEKKIWPKYFQEIIEGKKVFEVRLSDFEIEEGDILILREWDPEKQEYTGRVISRIVSTVFKPANVEFWTDAQIKKHGFQVIGFWRNQIDEYWNDDKE